jgi:hypothetical protein
MSLLKSLEKLIGVGHQQAAVQAQPAQGQLLAHQAAAGVLGNNTPAARMYQQNPMDPRVTHMDPAQFGYGAENPRLQVGRPIPGVADASHFTSPYLTALPQDPQLTASVRRQQGTYGLNTNSLQGNFLDPSRTRNIKLY